MMAGSILGNLLNFTMRENVALAFNFPFWYGIQAHDQLWLQLNSSFGHVEMINEKNASKWAGKGFWQELPLELEASYAVNHYFDVGLTFGFSDVMKAKDTMVVGLNLAARAGRLFE